MLKGLSLSSHATALGSPGAQSKKRTWGKVRSGHGKLRLTWNRLRQTQLEAELRPRQCWTRCTWGMSDTVHPYSPQVHSHPELNPICHHILKAETSWNLSCRWLWSHSRYSSSPILIPTILYFLSLGQHLNLSKLCARWGDHTSTLEYSRSLVALFSLLLLQLSTYLYCRTHIHQEVPTQVPWDDTYLAIPHCEATLLSFVIITNDFPSIMIMTFYCRGGKYSTTFAFFEREREHVCMVGTEGERGS